jgi:hypothetical protein
MVRSLVYSAHLISQVENLLDPAHLPFTHEGTLAKRSDATLADIQILQDNLLDANIQEKIPDENFDIDLKHFR